jgi:predicted PurR-regulated permease PerM
MKTVNWTRILTILLVILASYAILYVTASILVRFTQAILLFVLGAIFAYVLTPLVNRLEAAFRFRWLAIILSYMFVGVALFALGVLLFTPFVQQSQSLVDNLHTPSKASLSGILRVQEDAAQVQRTINGQNERVTAGFNLDSSAVRATTTSIARVQQEASGLRNGTVSGPKETHVAPVSKQGKQPPNPPSQTRVPQSYVNAILAPLATLTADYQSATQNPANVNALKLGRARGDARRVEKATSTMYQTMSTTPILLLHSQAWLDDHGIRVDLHSKFGQAASQLSNQGTYLLNNAITILSETANVLLNLILILIISVYLVSDGGRMIRGAARVVPPAYRDQAWFFISSLDTVLGGYIRGQLFISALAGVLGGGGAAVLGVPYPLLIGIMTFILESIPVIGPMVAVVPAIAISLFFDPYWTTIILAVWFIVYQQIVTNVLGPRIMGMAVGIHPLEALLAVLIGFPLGGLLGAFLAVPVAGIIHILIREAYNYFALGQAIPTVPVPTSSTAEAPAEQTSSTPVSKAPSPGA